MPTYSYRCEDCSHEYDAFQSITEEPHQTCPQCNGGVQRLIGAGAGILFKGSGFYTTDYRDSPKGAAQKGQERADQSAAKESNGGAAGGEKGNAGSAGGAGNGSGRGRETAGATSGNGQSSSGAYGEGRKGAVGSAAKS